MPLFGTATTAGTTAAVAGSAAFPPALIALMAAQGAIGLGQKLRASRMRRKAEREFDNYNIPSSALNYLEQARLRKSQNEIPAADLYRMIAEKNTAQAVETAGRTASTASEQLGVLGNAYDSQRDFDLNLAIKGAEWKEQGRSAYMDALNYMTDLETKRWYYTEYMPYAQKMGAAAQFDQSGNTNVQSAIGSGINVAGAGWEINEAKKRAAAEREFEMKRLKELYG